MTGDSKSNCWPKSLLSGAVAFLALYSAAGSLETHLLLPGLVWIIGGILIASGWAYEKFCRFEVLDNGSHDCSACGVFGHKLPWVLLVGCGLANLTDMSAGWSAFSAYAIGIALFSLAGSFFMMRISETGPEDTPAASQPD